MKSKIYFLLISVWIYGLLLSSCSDDNNNTKTISDDEPIEIKGLVTRANGDQYPNLYLRAIVGGYIDSIYIEETPISTPSGLFHGNPEEITFPNGSPYYPLGNNDINFYAYSGKWDANNQIQLTSGTSLENDALLSNYGMRLVTGGPTQEGLGTPGSSENPASILQFRHLMTQVNVKIEVIDSELDPDPTSITIGMPGLAATGTYSPTAVSSSNVPADNLSDTYLLGLGVNYVVPSGDDLSQMTINYLKIDDYEANRTDLEALTIEEVVAPSTGSALLLPGLAYTITFHIYRLQVQAITIDLVDWNATEFTPDQTTYDPYILDLDLGDYEVAQENDRITKVVLYTADREYVGGVTDNGDISFLYLPQDGVEQVALYTNQGLLIEMAPDDYNFDPVTETGELELILSQGGMRLEDPKAVNSTDNPYLLTTAVQVIKMSRHLDGYYRQMADIDVDKLIYAGSSALTPLGTFTGEFDGNGFVVDNLLLDGGGLITRNEGVIKHLHVGSGKLDAAGTTTAGAICAVNAGKLVACVNEARIVNAPAYAGGICGTNEAGGVLIACLNSAPIEDGTTIGGLCGLNENTDTDSFVALVNTGLMTKTATTIGGIIGESAVTGNNLITHSFWLVGTAAQELGGPEMAVGTPITISITETTALSPERLRKLPTEQDETAVTLALLNTAISQTIWAGEYEYVINQNTTGSVWPVPVSSN